MIDDFKIIKYENGNNQEPPIINGPSGGLPDLELDFNFITNDPENDDIEIMIDWGDGEITDWLGSYQSGEEVTISHTYEEEGTYQIKAKSKDIWDDSRWSDPFVIEISTEIFPKICCDPVGLIFGNVSAGSTVNGKIYVCNCGDEGSVLNWYVDTGNLPSWGTWIFTPESGTGIEKDDCVDVDVTCVVTETQGTYSGTITVFNSDDISDKCIVDTSVNVPRVRARYNPFVLWLIEQLPIIEVLFQLL
jgi:hypothetical protein